MHWPSAIECGSLQTLGAVEAEAEKKVAVVPESTALVPLKGQRWCHGLALQWKATRVTRTMTKTMMWPPRVPVVLADPAIVTSISTTAMTTTRMMMTMMMMMMMMPSP